MNLRFIGLVEVPYIKTVGLGGKMNINKRNVTRR